MRVGRRRTSDATAFLVYAMRGQQSHFVLRTYKASWPVRELRRIIALLCQVGLTLHARCVGRILGVPVTHWATVPSLPAKAVEHPLHEIVNSITSGRREVRITASSRLSGSPRQLNAEHFQVSMPIPADSHVLLIDDTRTTGGHAQSATMALRAAGVKVVSVLALARFLKDDFADNAEFIRNRLTRDYDPFQCPWTGDSCPSSDRS
jgi:hypothetical protein